MSTKQGLAAVAATGDTGATLRSLRDLLAGQIEVCESGRDLAALTARLTDVLQRITELPADHEGTALDELARRRAAGDGVAARTVRSGGGAV